MNNLIIQQNLSQLSQPINNRSAVCHPPVNVSAPADFVKVDLCCCLCPLMIHYCISNVFSLHLCDVWKKQRSLLLSICCHERPNAMKSKRWASGNELVISDDTDSVSLLLNMMHVNTHSKSTGGCWGDAHTTLMVQTGRSIIHAHFPWKVIEMHQMKTGESHQDTQSHLQNISEAVLTSFWRIL